eukprot:1161754-Pelagomonas_calceolata.AAC.6
MQPPEVYSYLSRVMYNRRSKFDPLWNSLVVGGVSMEGEPFLDAVLVLTRKYLSMYWDEQHAHCPMPKGESLRRGTGVAYDCDLISEPRLKIKCVHEGLKSGYASKHVRGLVGMTGTHYTNSHVTTGFANALARPLLRAQQRDDMSEGNGGLLLRANDNTNYVATRKHERRWGQGLLLRANSSAKGLAVPGSNASIAYAISYGHWPMALIGTDGNAGGKWRLKAVQRANYSAGLVALQHEHI